MDERENNGKKAVVDAELMNGVNHKVEFLPRDVLQLPSNDVEQRQDRQGSFITDKDPSFI